MLSRSRALHEALVTGAAQHGTALDISLSTHSGGHDWAWWQPTMLHEVAALLR